MLEPAAIRVECENIFFLYKAVRVNVSWLFLCTLHAMRLTSDVLVDINTYFARQL